MKLKNIGLILAGTFSPLILSASESLKGEKVGFLGVEITNSMLTTLVFAVVIVILLRLMIGRKASVVPSKGQVVIETMMGAVKDVIAPIMGKRATEAAFPLIICFFFYILLNNWSGLLPFAETLFDIQSVNIDASQVAQYQNEGYEIVKNADIITAIKQVPIYKPANSDLNSTLALSLISFIAWIYFVMRYAGPKALYYDWFGNKADKNELPKMLYLAMFGIFFFVGCIEVVSALLRVVSLSFRLFGNNFGGEKLIASMGNFAFPFYFLEIIIGLVQALIFSLLTAIYIGLITNHDTAEH